ncbi:hypothetical protein OG439_32955 [Amycolatopsis sp. NBC_01307]|uniref:hypothetical protein n=1 Tax=Amycolatopsis sp. NBC_01307 TaxID=2903561 RepID=UPI002E14ACA4|nr:hypothetical protein OG439_32955 [Amycolatopsis sp. NBC_01307]
MRKSLVLERPRGSGINGRPALADNLKHLAFHDDGVFRTWCGQEVPREHQCPAVGRRPDGTSGAVLTCWDCDLLYKRERGLPVTPDHPAYDRH